MRELASAIVSTVKPYFDVLLRKDAKTGRIVLFDDELGDLASCCTTGSIACFYILDSKLHEGNGTDTAELLVQEVRYRQLPNGAFTQPYYAKQGEPSVIDIAEIGAVANSLYHIYRCTGSQEAKESLLLAADYLLTQIAKANPGAVLKRPDSDFDVLNGNMYAAHTFGRAYEVSGNSAYLEKADRIFNHLADRFGQNKSGWWPYIERWDGEVVMGNSVLYQATIVAFAHTVLPLLPATTQERWQHVSEAAVSTILSAIRNPPSEETESPWWTRDWTNGWELYLALWRDTFHAESRPIAYRYFQEVERNLKDQGLDRFQPKVHHKEPDRTPVTTTFRKAAGFAGSFSYLMLDDWDSNSTDQEGGV